MFALIFARVDSIGLRDVHLQLVPKTNVDRVLVTLHRAGGAAHQMMRVLPHLQCVAYETAVGRFFPMFVPYKCSPFLVAIKAKRTKLIRFSTRKGEALYGTNTGKNLATAVSYATHCM